MSDVSDVILLLGASSDIGCEIIREIDDGKALILAHFNSNGDKLKKLQSEVKSKIVPLQADLRHDDAIDVLVAEVRKHADSPTKIIHLPASKFAYARFREQNWSRCQTELDIELRSIYRILQVFLPVMAKKRDGRVLFMLSSVCTGMPPKALTSYTIAKYALLGLMKSVAVEYSDRGITVNAVSPSMMESAFLSEIPEKMVEIAAALNPLKRNAMLSDVAPVFRFLLSPEAAFINGQNININAGMS